ncbi:MAG: NADH-quinone oxidoreductase subunit J [Opitutaceae bacterium]|nr:NADH-quinone oxidoreductase subunit J [Opitutaceae bacterium]
MTSFPFASYIVAAAFAVAAITMIAGALIAVLSKRIIRGVGGLMICCIGLAGLYYFLQSPFLALMEILIYVGAVCVTIVFGVMLSEPDEPKPTDRVADLFGAIPIRSGRFGLWGAAAAFLVCTLIGIGIARLSLGGPWPVAPARVSDGSVAAIGIALLTTYSLAFELISLVLLLAILGALVIARSGRTKPPSTAHDQLGILAAQVTAPAPPSDTHPLVSTTAGHEPETAPR